MYSRVTEGLFEYTKIYNERKKRVKKLVMDLKKQKQKTI